KNVYSSRGIQADVRKVLSKEFVSSSSAIKLMCTCPTEVYDLLLAIVSVKPLATGTKTTKQQKYFINSPKSLQHFTMSFCPKEKLIAELRDILQDLRTSKTKLTKLSELTRQHVQFVNEVKMYNAIADDLTNGEYRNPEFAEQIGSPHKEGLYLEEHFIRVFFLCILFCFTKLIPFSYIRRNGML
ncbi:MAG: hypothetical protein V4591_06720, partial [Bdellovibrionota bacterium]